jgi:hypothetical protein
LVVYRNVFKKASEWVKDYQDAVDPEVAPEVDPEVDPEVALEKKK